MPPAAGQSRVHTFLDASGCDNNPLGCNDANQYDCERTHMTKSCFTPNFFSTASACCHKFSLINQVALRRKDLGVLV